MADAGDLGREVQRAPSATLLAAAADGVILMEREGRVLAFNPACEKLFGYASSEVVGQNIKLIMPHLSPSAHGPDASNDGEPGHAIGIGRDLMGLRKDASIFPLHVSVGEGGLAGRPFLVVIIRDLSAANLDVERRIGLDHFLAQIVKTSDDAIISKTLGGLITSWNPAAERIFGFTAKEAIGRHISIIFPPDRLAEEDEIVAKLKAGEHVEHYETVRLHKNGREVLVSLSVAPIRDGQGRIIGASKTARDISERKRVEREAEDLQNELIHVSRLSAMGQMSAAIAHELNQPLTAMTNYAKAAERMLNADQVSPQLQRDLKDVMGKVAAQAMRAGTIIRYLRDFAEKRDHRKLPEDLNEAVREAMALGMVGRSYSNLRVMLELAPDLPCVTMDKVQI